MLESATGERQNTGRVARPPELAGMSLVGRDRPCSENGSYRVLDRALNPSLSVRSTRTRTSRRGSSRERSDVCRRGAALLPVIGSALGETRRHLRHVLQARLRELNPIHVEGKTSPHIERPTEHGASEVDGSPRGNRFGQGQSGCRTRKAKGASCGWGLGEREGVPHLELSPHRPVTGWSAELIAGVSFRYIWRRAPTPAPSTRLRRVP
jgi:hypothetical protein